MEDTFLLLKEPSPISSFLADRNSQHPNIRFTCDVEQNIELSSTTCHNECFSANANRKLTFTGLGLHFLSYIPYIYNINSLKTLINRAYNICSMWVNFRTKAIYLKDNLTSNGYPSRLFHNALNNFLYQKLSYKPAVTTVEKDKYITTIYRQS